MTLPKTTRKLLRVLIVLTLFALTPVALLTSQKIPSGNPGNRALSTRESDTKATLGVKTEFAGDNFPLSDTGSVENDCWGINNNCDKSCEIVEYSPVLDYGDACRTSKEVTCNPQADVYYAVKSIGCDRSGQGACYSPAAPLKAKGLCPKLTYHSASDPSCSILNNNDTCDASKDTLLTGKYSCGEYRVVTTDMQPCQWLDGTTKETHTSCEDGGSWTCIVNSGPGQNECSTAEDCRSSPNFSPLVGNDPAIITTPEKIEKVWYKDTHEWIKAAAPSKEEKLTMILSDLPPNMKLIQCDNNPGEVRCLIQGIPTVNPGNYAISAKVSLGGTEAQTFSIPFVVTEK